MNKAYSALLMLASMPLHATSIYVDFNSPDDLANGFSQQFPNNPAPSQTGGIGNTGSLVGSGRATYNNTSFDFSEYGSKITVSTSFFLDLKDDLTEGLGYTWGLIFLVPEANSYLYADDSLFVDFSSSYPTGGELEDRIFGGPLQQGGGGFPGFHDVFTPGTYIEGHWYELATTFENLNGQIGFHTKVNDYGVDGGGVCWHCSRILQRYIRPAWVHIGFIRLCGISTK